MKYRIVHSDPSRWVYDPLQVTVKTAKEAKAKLKELLNQYPLTKHGYAKIEKVELVLEVKYEGDK